MGKSNVNKSANTNIHCFYGNCHNNSCFDSLYMVLFKDKKIEYYKSSRLLELLNKTEISNKDFEDFLKINHPSETDFIFLDPPYDSDFSTYAKNTFDKSDQKRLADYLINECKAKWMMVIKNTPYILSLYNNNNLNIKTFDKTYLVSFMNRNDKKTEHLLITNY